MTVTVQMTSEEFTEFLNWKREEGYYAKQLKKAMNRTAMLINKVQYAIEPDSKKPNKYKIADHDHADDLFLLCSDFHDDGGG